jgi:hypothetical protein
VARYGELGVHRLVPIGLGGDADALVACAERYAEALPGSP